MSNKINCLEKSDTWIENNLGLRWQVWEESPGQFALGEISFNGDRLETALRTGLFCLRHRDTQQIHWCFAEKIEKVDPTKLVFSGDAEIEGVTIEFQVAIETPLDVNAVSLIYSFKFSNDLTGYELCLLHHDRFSRSWSAHLYPWVADSKWVERERLDNMGIPAVLLCRDDRSLGVLWGIDPNFDYLNPTTWTRNFGLFFIDNILPAQYRIGGGEFKEGIDYTCPMQIIISNQSHPDRMIKDLLRTWIKHNQYRVNPLFIRSNDEALNFFIKGRLESDAAWIPGKGYSLHGERHTFLYFGVQGMGAYFDYLMYEMTGNPTWRQRAFEQMDFIIQGQNRDPNDFNYGAIHTTYQLEWMDDYGPSGPGFNSDDRFNIGYKPDVCALLVRYMLLLWKRLKEHEGIDRQDWYDVAILAANWIIRQLNPDGGLPQKVQQKPLEMRWMDDDHYLVIKPFKSRSSASGRALPSFSTILEITGEEKYKKFLDRLENYTVRCVQNRYYFTGQHPDLPPYELEEASIWGVAEYWLNRYDETGDEIFLQRAEANAYLAFSWWCPVDLSWVTNPTQGGVAEQQHFQQYSVYNYQNRKVEGLWRLYQFTQDPLYYELFERILQNIYFTQETEGGNMGGTYERIADPWLVREETPGGPKFDSMGVNYTNEQALDCFLQVLEMCRMGTALYADEGVTHKIYSDGACFYSRDVLVLEPIHFSAIPSTGSIELQVDEWLDGCFSWQIIASEPDISLVYRVGKVVSKGWYEISANGQTTGRFQANHEGELSIVLSGNFTVSTKFQMVEIS
jgi:hypothetical protein